MRLVCGTQSVDLTRPVVMGVVNVTPDSFSDGGHFATVDAAVAHALRLIDDGAAIIDIGGESTRPGASPVDAATETARVIPVIRALRESTSAIVSIDTSKPEVMAAAIAAGASFINDVRALREPGAIAVAAASGAAICLMHMQGEPRTMQAAPVYRDVVTEVQEFLLSRVHACRSAGIAVDRIAIDPGFGFGKSVEHNLELLRALPSFAALGYPVLVGLSRKSMLAALTNRPVEERLAGSVALAAIAASNGASIVRAHDVAATVDAVRIAGALRAS